MTAEVLRESLPQPTRTYRRRIWVPAFGLGPLVLTDDQRVWRLAYLRPAGGAR
jgi:hypothetical protein